MATTSDRKFKLKLLIEKESQELLFAEVGKDVVDFLLSLLSLPIGSVTKLITEKSTFSPLRNMYCSWKQLDHSFLSSSELTPKRLFPVISPKSSSNFSLLLSSASSAIAKEYVYKLNCNCNYFTDVRPSVDIDAIYCKSCLRFCPYTRLSYVGPSVTKEAVERDGYVKDGVTYFLFDDLSVVPMTPVTSIFESIAFFNSIGFKDLNLLEEKSQHE